MKLPILSYGHEILNEKCIDLQQGAIDLPKILEDMWDTVYGAEGCGLAAPQVALPYRLFLVDSVQTYREMSETHREKLFDGDEGIREVFINPRITRSSERTWKEAEGCLSVPSIYQPVERPWSIHIEYLNQDFEVVSRTFSGITARMIQHEYDHIEGVLFLQHLKPLTRLLLKGKLLDISAGKASTSYPMKFGKDLKTK